MLSYFTNTFHINVGVFDPAGLDLELVKDEYIVSENEESEDSQDLLIRINGSVSRQDSFHLSLKPSKLPGSDDNPVIATPNKDFLTETIHVEVSNETVGEQQINLRDIIKDDKTVESLFQNFTLSIEIEERGIYFDQDNTTNKSANIAIEDDDSKFCLRILSNNLNTFSVQPSGTYSSAELRDI